MNPHRGNSVARSGTCPFTRRVTDLSPVVTAELMQARGRAQEELKERASAAARSHFGRNVFVRAVVEVSNFCRENCAYCGMRRDNRALDRFRAAHDTLADVLIHHLPASVTDVNIQGGEDPVVTRQVVLPLIRTLRHETKLGVSVCLGTLSAPVYDALREAGASTYILKFEMADPELYEAMEAPGTLAERVEHTPHAVERKVDPLRMQRQEARDDLVVGAHACAGGAGGAGGGSSAGTGSAVRGARTPEALVSVRHSAASVGRSL